MPLSAETPHNEPQKEFLWPGPAGSEALIEALGRGLALELETTHVIQRTFYDTFDWLLYQGDDRGGGTLCEDRRNGRRILEWRPLRVCEPVQVQPCRATPKVPAALAQGPVRERILPLCDVRVLLPVVVLEVTQGVYRVLDDERKTVLRIALESCRVTFGQVPEGAPAPTLETRVHLWPVRGYTKALDTAAGMLAHGLGLALPQRTVLEDALAAIGQRPMGYSARLDFRFEPRQRADQVAKAIQLHLWNVLEANLDGVRRNLDPEFLHDLRVAVRRARSALTQIKGVFDESDVARFKDRLGWVGQVTGPTRDMDVYLLHFPEFVEALPAPFRAHLEPLHRFLENHQRMEHRRLVRHLGSKEFRSLQDEWRAFLEAPVPRVATTAPDGVRPVAEVASERIRRMYKRVMKEGLAIGEASPAEELHELRKSCKKLRYLIEFFRSLYAEEEAAALIRTLKRLLDNLGAFQDLHVQAEKLRAFAHQMVEESLVPADTLLAMGMLVESLWLRQQQARAEFAERFAEFASDENQQRFRTLFGGKKG